MSVTDTDVDASVAPMGAIITDVNSSGVSMIVYFTAGAQTNSGFLNFEAYGPK
jgi:hypothetical protein